MSCEKPVNTPFYLDTSKLFNFSLQGTISATEVEDSCRLEQMVLTSRPGNDHPNISCTEVHNELVYGMNFNKEMISFI